MYPEWKMTEQQMEPNMLADYCWTLVQETPTEENKETKDNRMSF
jgi:hypothetical protein